MPMYWHDSNPWKDKLIYISADEAGECIGAGGYSLIARYKKEHPHIATYLLPQPDGTISLGVRYGADPENYYSPPCRNQAAARRMVAEGNIGQPVINHTVLIAKLINRIIEVEGSFEYLLESWASPVKFSIEELDELRRIAAIEQAAVRDARLQEVEKS